VLATQTLIQRKSNNMRVVVDGKLPPDVSAKDIILAVKSAPPAASVMRSNFRARRSARCRWKAA